MCRAVRLSTMKKGFSAFWRSDEAKMLDLTKFSLPDADARSPLRGMHSLTRTHCAYLAKASVELPGTWPVETHEGYDGDLTLLLLPTGDDAAALVVSRTAGGFHLHANRGDDIRKVGSFVSIESLWEAVRGMAPIAPVNGDDAASPSSPIKPGRAA